MNPGCSFLNAITLNGPVLLLSGTTDIEVASELVEENTT